ncbi:MAG: hypothetical protein POG24_09265, partial [Acidocella sp.]|nr:hypothetical protein [Acidocella sp.]
ASTTNAAMGSGRSAAPGRACMAPAFGLTGMISGCHGQPFSRPAPVQASFIPARDETGSVRVDAGW